MSKRGARKPASDTAPAVVDAPADVAVIDAPASDNAPAVVPAVDMTAPAVDTPDAPAPASDVPAPDAPASDVPPAPAAFDAVSSFRSTFPAVETIPAWIVPMVTTIRAAFDATTPESRRNFDAVSTALHAADSTPRAENGHRYTGGSGRDIARTQNAIYVAFAVSGIRYADVPTAFGAAVWAFVIGPAKCDYRSHAGYFRSTLSDYVSGRHNDTPGVGNGVAESAVRAWMNAGRA